MKSIIKSVVLSTALLLGVQTSYAASLPDYYPKDYSEIVEASKKEGTLLVYMSAPASQYPEFFKGFKELYPWIEVSVLDLNGDVLFGRFDAEVRSGVRSADIVSGNSIAGWSNFLENGYLLNYKSAEDQFVPDWAKPNVGQYLQSSDPLLIWYNKKILTDGKVPTGTGSLSKLIKDNPNLYRVTAYSPTAMSTGRTMMQTMAKRHKDGWDYFSSMVPNTRFETSGGTMLTKLVSGEYNVIYGMNTGGFILLEKNPAYKELVGWSFMDDGTVIQRRYTGIAKNSANVNSAKLYLDYAMSRDGQINMGKSGYIPIRPDLKDGDVRYFSYNGIIEKIGANNAFLVGEGKDQMEEERLFDIEWKQRFGK